MTVPNIRDTFPNLNTAATWTLTGASDTNGHTTLDTLFDTLSDYSANTFYWMDSGPYIDITFNQAVNIYACGSESYPTYRCDLIAYKWDGTTWQFYQHQPTPRAYGAVWTKIFSELPAGRYLFKHYTNKTGETDKSGGDPYRMDSEWFIEQAAIVKGVLAKTIEGTTHYYTCTVAAGVYTLVDLGTSMPTEAIIRSQGMTEADINAMPVNILTPDYDVIMYSDAAFAQPKADCTYISTATVNTITALTGLSLNKYTGVEKISISGNGGKYAVSFDGGASWKARKRTIVSTGKDVLPKMSSFSQDGFVITPPTGFEYIGPGFAACFDDVGYNAQWAMYNSPVNITFAMPSKKIVCALALSSLGTADIPTAWGPTKVWGSNNGTDWSLLLDVNLSSVKWVAGEKKTFTFSTVNGYSFYKLYTMPTSWFCPGEIELIEANAVYEWIDVTPDELPDKGMSPITLADITLTDYASIFQPTSLDVIGYLVKTSDAITNETINSIIVMLPPDKAPTLNNVTLSATTTHQQDLTITFDAADPEGEVMQKRLSVNNVAITDWSACVEGNNQLVLPYTALVPGSNVVLLEITDEFENIASQTMYVTMTNDPPMKTSSAMAGVVLNAVIGDNDSDPVSYKISVNGNVQKDWSEFVPTPFNLKFMVDRKDITFGQPCTVKVEFKDPLGATGSFEETFIGSYYGLLFTDENGDYYSTDMNVVLKRLQMGAWVVGQNSLPQIVRILNTTGVALQNIRVAIDPTSVPPNTYVKLSHDLPTFDDADIIDITKTVNNGDYVTFQVRISSELSATGGGIFKIKAVGTPA